MLLEIPANRSKDTPTTTELHVTYVGYTMRIHTSTRTHTHNTQTHSPAHTRLRICTLHTQHTHINTHRRAPVSITGFVPGQHWPTSGQIWVSPATAWGGDEGLGFWPRFARWQSDATPPLHWSTEPSGQHWHDHHPQEGATITTGALGVDIDAPAWRPQRSEKTAAVAGTTVCPEIPLQSWHWPHH